MASPICADAAPPPQRHGSGRVVSESRQPSDDAESRPIHVLHHQSEVTARERGAAGDLAGEQILSLRAVCSSANTVAVSFISLPRFVSP